MAHDGGIGWMKGVGTRIRALSSDAAGEMGDQ